MFGRVSNKELDRRFESLWSEINRLRDECASLDWRVANPPKYKVGDKTKDGICTSASVAIKRNESYGSLGCLLSSEPTRKWSYMFEIGNKTTIITE